MKKHLLIFNLIVLTAFMAAADNFLPDMSGRLFHVSNTHINKICQDYKGYIWLATDYGLTRFDGTEAIQFVRDDRAGALLSNNVLTVIEDSSHQLWVGTTSGIQKLDSSTFIFTTPRLSYPNVPDFSYVNAIIEDRNGKIWFTTSRSGAVCVDKNGENPEFFMTTNSGICSNKTSELFEDRFGNIWIGTMDSGVSVYNPANKTIHSITHQENDASSLSSNMIFSITQVNDGRIFIASPDGGIDSYDYRTNKVTRNVISVEGNVYKLKNVSDENALYIGTDGSGLFKYDLNSNKMTRVEIVTKEFNFDKSKIHDILYDMNGNLWLGVYQKGPLMATHNSDNTILNLGYNPFTPSLHTGTEPVLCALQSADGAMWIGTDGDGVYRAEHLGAPFCHLPLSAAGSNVVLAFLQDRSGVIWAGNYLDGLTRYNASGNKFEPVSIPVSGSYGGHVKEINTISEAPDGKLWLGTNGNGVCVYDSKTGATRFYTHNPLGDPDRQLLGNAIHAILFDGDDIVWIGTSDAGLSRLDLRTGMFKHFNTSNMQLSNNCVLSLGQDASGALWVGTQMGLNRIKDGYTQIFNTAHGLLDNLVYGIVCDDNGRLWLSTGKGISCLNTENLEFDTFRSNGKTLRGEFKRGSACKGLDGRIYFGGVGGMVSFVPSSTTPERQLARVDFGTMKILSASAADDSTSVECISLIDRTEMVLDYDCNSFTVSFGAVEYVNPEGVSYAVRLDEHDKGWIDLPEGVRVATWSLLPPGEYNLRVMASINGFAPVENAIKLIIRPPFYLTGWAKILYIAVVLGLIWAIYKTVKWKLRQIKERDQRDMHAQATEMKLQYFTDISHEIRTPLTMILSPLESLRERTRDRESLRTIDVMQYNGNRILRLINQIVDLRKFDNNSMRLSLSKVNLRDFIANISQAFSIVAEQRNIHYSVDIDENLPEEVCIDADKIDKVLFNVLGNAFKFTPAGREIAMRITMQDNNLAIRISDSGPGIPAESLDSVFNRFFRASNADTNATGSGIGLHLSRKMMDLHGGSIEVETTSDTGTTFLIIVPLASVETECPDIVDEPEPHDKVTSAPDTRVRRVEDIVSTKHATILIVEDNESIREYLASKLSEHFNVEAVDNGQAGLDKVMQLHPDLVLCDIMMEGIDGLELCRKIRSNPSTCEIPVVMLTAKITPSQQNDGILAGADAYITKPFNYVHLLNRINMLIHNRRQLKEKYSGTKELNDEVVKIKSSDEKLMERVRKVVIDELANPDLSVEFIAERVGVSRSHLHRRLKVVANMNPSEYIRSERMRHAAMLLVTKNVGISEVAYATGFSTLSHFSTCFKEHFGMSPTRYVAVNKQDTPEL